MSFVPNTEAQRAHMLQVCGARTIADLFADIPDDLQPASFDLPPGRSELEIDSEFRELAAQNYSHLTCFVGAGYYDHFVPAAVDALTGRSEFYTSYTPYQPECSQGTLQATYEYQSQICRLTGMELSNASLYDGGTALYEACQMAIHATGRRKIVLDGGVSPIFRKMLYTYTANLSIAFHEVPVSHGQTSRARLFESLDDDTAGVILQNPNFFGSLDDHGDVAAKCRERGILTIQSVYPVALALIKSPGECGIDIATGEGQCLGIPLSFGGPYLGFLAARKALARKMPGRIVGRTVDRNGKEAFVLTLQAREQHVRRQKATSNICTNQALCALRASAYLSLLGTQGLRDVATLCLNKAHYAKDRIGAIPGVEVMEYAPTFNEFTVRLPVDAAECVGRMIERGFAAGFPLGRYFAGLENHLLVAVTEKRTKYDIGQLAETLEAVLCP